MPLNVGILRALAHGPKSLAELRQLHGAPPQTTMRKRLAALAEAGILSKQRQAALPAAGMYALEGPGTELAGVAKLAEGWLAIAPDGPIELGTVAAKSTIKALVDGWSTTLLRALVARPLTLTELDALIAGVSYPSLERRLLAMRLAGQVKASSALGRGTPYVVTDWLRLAIGPLIAAARWERRHLAAETAPIGRIDVESAFLLAVPLLSLAPSLSGICRLAVDAAGGEQRVGVLVGIEEGRVVFCRARLEGQATARASGSVTAWFSAAVEGDMDQLELGGDRRLVDAVLDGLRVTVAKPLAV